MATLNTVDYYKNNLVNYSEEVQNEPRYKKDGILDNTIYYPLGNIYYDISNNNLVKLPKCSSNITEKWFMSRLKDQQIEYSIKFLQVEALKKYIIKNYESCLFKNPFYFLFHTYYPINKNIDAAKNIMQILIDNYSDYYDLIINLRVHNKELEYIKDLLLEFLPIDSDNICSICLYTEPKNLLINCCNCKTGAHANCLIKLNEYKPLDKCSVCFDKYKINDPVIRTKSGIVIRQINEKIFFPYNDLYYEPLLSNNNLYKYKDMDRLTMAILYLQTKRVHELLQENEVLEKLTNYYIGYNAYKQTPIHILCTGNMYTNAHYTFGNNGNKYYSILVMLLHTNKFNIEQKDAFDKTPMDYVNENNLDELKIVLLQYVKND